MEQDNLENTISQDTKEKDEYYRVFLGYKNPDYYIQKFNLYDRLGGAFQASWNWPAFFLGAYWFLFRKMYLPASAVLIATLISFVFPPVGLLVAVCSGIIANGLYYNHAKDKIEAAKLLEKLDDTKFALTYHGGVHTWAIWLGIILSLILILVVASIIK